MSPAVRFAASIRRTVTRSDDGLRGSHGFSATQDSRGEAVREFENVGVHIGFAASV